MLKKINIIKKNVVDRLRFIGGTTEEKEKRLKDKRNRKDFWRVFYC